MYRQCEPRVLAYALRRAPPEVAKDAVAEAFLAAWRRFDDLSSDPLPWLVGATRKALANQRRSSGRQMRLTGRLASLAVVGAAPAGSSEEASATRAALARLSATEREALLLIGWDGLSPSQAAASLGCSATAFRVRLHRARRRFARLLADQPRDPSRWHPAVTTEEASHS
jgi:RNA polymerase sigma factor (sigma-70 family)